MQEYAEAGFLISPLISPIDKTWQNIKYLTSVICFFHYPWIILEEKNLILHYVKMRHWDEADMTNLIYLSRSKVSINTAVKTNISLNK